MTQQPTISRDDRESLNRANCAICLIESPSNCKACPWNVHKAFRDLAKQETPCNLTAIRNEFTKQILICNLSTA